jgi:hypothetical protein
MLLKKFLLDKKKQLENTLTFIDLLSCLLFSFSKQIKEKEAEARGDIFFSRLSYKH